MDYKAVVQKHFFGSTSRALLGPLAGFFEWTEWTGSDAVMQVTGQHWNTHQVIPCRTWVGIGENCLVKVLFIQLIELPKCALLFRSKLMQFILWPCSNSAGGCLLL